MKTENPLASDQPLTIEQVFQQVDADNSGRIEFQELAEWWSAHQKQSRGSTDEQALMRCMDLFEQYDPKGKGLGEHEFRELMAELARGDWKQVMDPATNRQYWAHPTSGKSLWVAPNVEDFLREQGIVDMSGGGGLDYADAEGDTSDEVYMRLNLWKIYLKMERQARSNHYNDGFTYIVYVILLTVVVLGNMPLSTSFNPPQLSQSLIRLADDTTNLLAPVGEGFGHQIRGHLALDNQVRVATQRGGHLGVGLHS